MAKKHPALDQSDPWGADVKVSQPVVSKRRRAVDLGGFAFTTGGITHNINEEEREAIFNPSFSPRRRE